MPPRISWSAHRALFARLLLLSMLAATAHATGCDVHPTLLLQGAESCCAGLSPSVRPLSSC